jgi:hypothetical protein
MQGSRHLRASALGLAALLATASIVGCWLPPMGATFFLDAPLIPIGGATGGGHVQFLLDTTGRSAFFELNGLLPDTDYSVMMDGVVVATLSTDPSGHTAENQPVLTSAFDPRSHRLAIVDPDGVEVLELPPPSDPRYASAEVAPLSSFGAGGGSVRTAWLGGVESVSVELDGVDAGSYDVLADGMIQGSIDTVDGHGQLVESPPSFDPETAMIEVQRGGVDYYAGGSRASIEGIDWCLRGSVEQPLDALTGGLGWASLTTRASCDRRFEILIEDVPMGDYDVVVGGVVEGVLTVGEDQFGATSGSALFTTNESSGLPLDFDPVGQPIEIEQDGVVYFSIAAYSPN